MSRTYPSIVATLLFCSVFASQSYAKAYYAGEAEMVSRSEVVAVVTITAVHKVEEKGQHWVYSEVADASVEKVLRGQLPSTIKLHGGENFICAQVHYSPGRYLVFLRRDGLLLVGSNWHLSVRPIKDEQIEWFTPGESITLSWQSAEKTLSKIQEVLKLGK